MRKLLAITAAAALLTISLASSVQAASPHQVDPAGMVPPLNPAFGPWICTVTGSGPVCRGSNEDSWTDADTGLVCDGQAVYATGSYSSNGTRWHLPDGRAVKTFFNNSSVETWTLSPTGTGAEVRVMGHWDQHYVYPIPGDLDSRVETITGADWQAVAKGVGVVFHDTGFVRFQPGVDTPIDISHGPTDSDHGNLDLVMPAVCAVLEG
jgi:hypothetical protein